MHSPYWLVFSVCWFFCGSAFAGSLSFSSNTYTVAENGTNIVVTVNRTGSTTAAASVTVVSAVGTAGTGDFTAVSQVLNWGIGDAVAKTVTVAIDDDNIVESTETFTLKLTAPVGDGTGADTTVSITDYEEGKLQLSSASFMGLENNLLLYATINRVSGTAGAASVKIKTSEITPPPNKAIKAVDYVDLDTTVSFADGESSKNVAITLKNDNVAEFSEWFKVTLSSPTGATLGAITTADIEIRDTDEDFTSTLKLLTKSTATIQQPQLVDLTQNSLLDSTKKILDLVNTIPILTLTDISTKQETDGLLSIAVETDKVFLRPVSVKRGTSGATPEINVRDDGIADFITSQGWVLEAQPALKGISVFQKALAELFLPNLVITQNGNITIQQDQGAPPFERDALNNVIVNYSFYNRWNFRPSMIAKKVNATAEGMSMVTHPLVKDEWMISVIFTDGTDKREQFLTSAPINGPELIQQLKSSGVDRCATVSAPCLVNVNNPKQLPNGIIIFDVPSTVSSSSATVKVTLLADYQIRKVPNFTPSKVGFRETRDLNNDGSGDYQMIYANGEEQYFFLVAAYVIP